MSKRELKFILVVLGAFGAMFFCPAQKALAVPSFARQSGMSCNACHTVFPELTPFGRAFKLGGYVFSKSDKLYEWPPPLAGLAQTSFTHTNTDQPKDSVEDTWANLTDTTQNDFFYLPQELGGYYAGRIFYKFGAFIQGTYDGIEDNTFLDMTEIRFANTACLAGERLVYGFLINNAPTLEDVWNSTPAWGFPFAASDVAPSPAAATLIDNGLNQQVGGLGGYLYWNNLLYVNATVYRTAQNGITEFLGAGTSTTTVVDDAVPYWRIALQHQITHHSFSVGTYGIFANVYPEGFTEGKTDQFTDIAFDAQYQYITRSHIFSAATTFIHEDQDWDASHLLGNTSNNSDSLDTFRINLNYYYRSDVGTFGGSVAYFSTTGDTDSLLYAPDPADGSRTGSPDSNGFILETNYTLLERYKLSLQYVIYDKFNGSHSNYDGFGRDASDNNTLFLLVWLMF